MLPSCLGLVTLLYRLPSSHTFSVALKVGFASHRDTAKGIGFGIQVAWVQTSALLFTSCVTLGKSPASLGPSPPVKVIYHDVLRIQ